MRTRPERIDEADTTSENPSRKEMAVIRPKSDHNFGLATITIAVAICALAECAPPIQAQSWLKVSDSGPSARRDAAMAYDSARGVVVLYGGWDGSYLGDTWEWDGSSWTQVSTWGPTRRDGHAMVYDSARGEVVMFGGQTIGGRENDTWTWDGSSWTDVTPFGLSPPDRHRHAMAYDSHRERVVIFGGADNPMDPEYGDTWEWNGSSWTQVSSAGPTSRQYHKMAYDSARRKVVLFGGEHNAYTSGDTWEWDGSNWTQVGSTGPSRRYEHCMAYDSARKVVVLFGGLDFAWNYKDDTWEWDGSAWKQVDVSGPSVRSTAGMTYDSARARVVMFGGTGWPYLGDTWEYGFIPDLKILFKKAKPKKVRIGKKLSLIAKVANKGTVKSSPTMVYYYLSIDKTLEATDTLLGGKNVKGIKRNKNKNAKLRITVPETIVPGAYWVIVKLASADTNVSNNVATSRKAIQIKE